MTLLIPILFFCSLNMATAKYIKKSFGFCVPLTLMMSSFVLYFSQMIFHTFNIGFWVLSIIAMVMLLDIAVHIKDFKELSIFSVGGCMFIIICVLYFMIDYNHRFQSFDEFYHWGTMVKESLRLDRFYCIKNSNLWIHKDYPPFMCLFEVLWCKLCNGYSEPNVLRAVHVFNLSIILCPLAEIIQNNSKITKSNITRIIFQEIVLFFLTLIIILLLDPWSFRISTTIMVDITTPLIYVYGFMVVHNHKDGDFSLYEVLALILTNSALLMTKQVGVAFVMLIDLYLMFVRISYLKKNQSLSVIEAGKFIVLCMIPFIIYSTWKLYIKGLAISGQFGLGGLSIREYIHSFYGQGLRHDTLVHFFNALFKINITTISFIPVSYFTCFVFVIVFLLIIYFWKKINKKDVFYIGIVFVCGTIGYVLLMSVLYLFCFNTSEMVNLASYDRYMSSYVLSEVMILYLIFAEYTLSLSTGFKPLVKMVLTFFVLLGLNPSNGIYMIPQYTRGNAKITYEQDADFVKKYTKTKSKVFVIYNKENTDQNWWGAYQAYLQYYLNDRSISHDDVNAYEMEWNPDNKKELEKVIQRNDYLYIKDTNPNLNQMINSYYGVTLKPDSVYQIVKKEGKYRLIQQNSFGSES